MRYVNIDREGKINLQGNPKVLYSVMMYTRLQLLTSSCVHLAKGLNIGIRYGIVRTQFKNFKDPITGKLVERKIIDYQTHLNRLCPLLALNYAMVLGSSYVYGAYYQMLANIEQRQDFSMLGPMHTILSGLKALWCHLGYEGAKIIRECCGAAGFS